jgi:hypothetical protein
MKAKLKVIYLIIYVCLPRVIIWRGSRIYDNLLIYTTIHQRIYNLKYNNRYDFIFNFKKLSNYLRNYQWHHYSQKEWQHHQYKKSKLYRLPLILGGTRPEDSVQAFLWETIASRLFFQNITAAVFIYITFVVIMIRHIDN